MKPNFTPGNWSAEFVEDGGYAGMFGAWKIKSGDNMIAIIDVTDYCQSQSRPFGIYEAEANAHLLKAAKNLYKVAELVVESQGWDANDPDEDRWTELYLAAKDAIAEARGES